MNAKRVIVALDSPSADDALRLARRLDSSQCRVKVGNELFTAAGPALIERLHAIGFDVFLDLKYHDIPNTVAAACRAASRLGVWMLNVHALGGADMMRAAAEAVRTCNPRPLVIGVTVLTSMDADALRAIGIDEPPMATVARLAASARACTLDGVVCSAQEAAMLRARCGADFKLVTPGIRPHGAPGDDQRRITTPAQALAAGADYLVIGRPIARAADPRAALEAVNGELEREGRGGSPA